MVAKFATLAPTTTQSNDKSTALIVVAEFDGADRQQQLHRPSSPHPFCKTSVKRFSPAFSVADFTPQQLDKPLCFEILLAQQAFWQQPAVFDSFGSVAVVNLITLPADIA